VTSRSLAENGRGDHGTSATPMITVTLGQSNNDVIPLQCRLGRLFLSGCSLDSLGNAATILREKRGKKDFDHILKGPGATHMMGCSANSGWDRNSRPATAHAGVMRVVWRQAQKHCSGESRAGEAQRVRNRESITHPNIKSSSSLTGT